MKRWMASVLAGAVLLAAQFFAGCTAAPASDAPKQATQGEITVKVLNIGQGDSILIQTGEKTVLVDTSDVDERDKLRAELKKADVKKIDTIILTHPHADHIGGMDVLLNEYPVGMVYDNGMPSTSKLYLGYVKKLKEKKIERKGLVAGDRVDLGGGAVFEVLGPSAQLVKEGNVKGYKHDPNNESVVGRLVFGDFSMMLTGDAEKKEEQAILAADSANVKSTILKSGHHGSKTSSSADFLRAVQPEAALISCGVNNDYGHPHKETMKKYHALNIPIYVTAENGTITVTSDGKTYKIVPERGEKQ
ncbi:ComEC/Rec2 family competence protein [Selenomonas dianae]|uniref:ComEC/Rec2 family competence protein n=1 Tax=Selenomonas dianae TaxID=135079 RepID=A0ABP3CE52_9FIRM|nr:ComEC/Rec2 family competence protein [Selenomonas dianae]WLD83149.1 ComEC/Rec2 family competence protein [Selenomonas dianae]